MNRKRRNQLGEAYGHLCLAISELDSVAEDESECLNNTPENFQDSESYSEREDALDDLMDAIEDIRSSAETISKML